MTRRLVLFDIDGTILSSNGAAPRAFRAALEHVYGTSGPRTGYSFAGRTDPEIARDLLTMAGLDRETIDRRLPDVWSRYTALLGAEFRSVRPTVFPGVPELLDRIESTASAVLGLLTGNVDEGARLKLEAAGIERGRFIVGAFGSDHADRRELPAIAVRRAADRVGYHFRGREVVIVGDTPADVACGRHLGVRTVAVATGTYGFDDLRACRPDHVLESFEDVAAACEAILA